MPKLRNFHAFTQAYLAHGQTNFPAAQSLSFLDKRVAGSGNEIARWDDFDEFTEISHLT